MFTTQSSQKQGIAGQIPALAGVSPAHDTRVTCFISKISEIAPPALTTPFAYTLEYRLICLDISSYYSSN